MEEQLRELAKEKGFDVHGAKKDGSDYFKDGYFVWLCLLQKWLREEHNIDAQAYLIEFLNNGLQVPILRSDREYAYRIYDGGIDRFISLNVPPYPTYEDALEEALQEALKPLEQLKTK